MATDRLTIFESLKVTQTKHFIDGRLAEIIKYHLSTNVLI